MKNKKQIAKFEAARPEVPDFDAYHAFEAWCSTIAGLVVDNCPKSIQDKVLVEFCTDSKNQPSWFIEVKSESYEFDKERLGSITAVCSRTIRKTVPFAMTVQELVNVVTEMLNENWGKQKL